MLLTPRDFTASRGRLVFALALLSAVATAGGCATDRQVVQQARGVHDGLEPAVIEDPQVAGYIQEVGDRIIRAAQELAEEGRVPKAARGADNAWIFGGDLRFNLVNSDTLNAFTTGGEHMYIYNQLFQESESEDELAAVMAHEFAHVYLRHVQQGMNRQYAQLAAAGVAGAAGYAVGGSESGAQYGGMFAGAAMQAAQLIGAGFTREDENEADKLGFALYTRAGWDPEKFDDFFQHMIEKGLDTAPELLSDHPSLRNRVAATQERIERLPPEAERWRRPPVAGPREFEALQRRAVEVARGMPNDQTLAQAQTLLSAFPTDIVPLEQPEQRAARQRLIEALERDAQRRRDGGDAAAQQSAARQVRRARQRDATGRSAGESDRYYRPRDDDRFAAPASGRSRGGAR